MQNNKYTAHDIRQICSTKLKLAFKGNSEQNAWYSLDGRKVCRLTVPHGRKNVKPKTYGSMARQLKLTVVQFDELLECSLQRAGYDAIVRRGLGSS